MCELDLFPGTLLHGNVTGGENLIEANKLLQIYIYLTHVEEGLFSLPSSTREYIPQCSCALIIIMYIVLNGM